jgi:CheY-like chemotaxis protein
MLMKSEHDQSATEFKYKNTARLPCANPSARALLIVLLLLSLNLAACYDWILSRLFGGLRRLRRLIVGRRRWADPPLTRPIFARFRTAKPEGVAKILVVEDDPVTARAYAQSLLRAGYEVRVAVTGPEALAQVPLWQPDGVLLDVLLPELDGIEVLRQIRRQQPNLPVIICTNLLSPVLKGLAEIGGATRVFDKSALTARELVSEFERALTEDEKRHAA